MNAMEAHEATMSETPDIISIINSYTSLEKRGNIYTGFCPFCGSADEKMVVRPELNEWHCFQCGIGGNAEDFVTLYEAMILHHPQVDERRGEVQQSAAPDTATPAAENTDLAPEDHSNQVLDAYFSRLRQVSGYIAAAVIDGNMQIISTDGTPDSGTDINKLNELFISIIDDTHTILAEDHTAMESEVVLSSDSGMVIFSSLFFREEPVHVIVLAKENKQQYLLRMHINQLRKY